MEESKNEIEISEQQINSIIEAFIKISNEFIDSEMKVIKLTEIPNGYIIYNAFSGKECDFLMKNLSFNETLEYRDETGEIYRQNSRIQFTNTHLSEIIFKRIHKILPNEYFLEKDEIELGAFSKGLWKLNAINPRFRMGKYFDSGFFRPHYDGNYILSKDERSFFTLMCYLNDDYEDGETNFFENNISNKIVLSIKPVKGMMIFFPQNLWHEGRKVKGEKYIFRTDVMFLRDESQLPPLSQEEINKKELAKQYLEMARDFERCKNGEKAVEYYRKAFKMDPDLEKVIT